MSVSSVVDLLLANKDINNEVNYYAELDILLPDYLKGMNNGTDDCFNSLLKHLFARRYCWGEKVDICDETLTYQFEHHDITIEVKTQINNSIENFFKLIISNINLTNYLQILTKISYEITNPLARQHLFLQSYKLVEDEYNNSQVYFFDDVKHLFLHGLTDIWSYTRKAASNIFLDHLKYFTVSNIDCFIHLLIDLYKTNPDWKIIEGLINSLCDILSSIKNISDNNVNVTTWNSEVMNPNEILEDELPKLLLDCVRHEQLSVREISIKGYILYLNKTRKNINELYYSFLLPQLQPYITDPLSSQGFFDLLRNVVPLLDINELYTKFDLIWDAISIYFSDEASTVRQSISSVFQSLCKVEKTQPKLILMIIQILVDFYDVNSKWQIRDTILLCYEYIFQTLVGENLDADQDKVVPSYRYSPAKINQPSTSDMVRRILKSPMHIQLSKNEMSMLQIIYEDENNRAELLSYLRRIIPQIQHSYSKEEGFEINRIANQISDIFSICVFHIHPMLLINQWINLEQHYTSKDYNNTLFILKTFNSVLKNLDTIEDAVLYQIIIYHSRQVPRQLLIELAPKFLETLYELGIKPFSDNIGMLALKLIFDVYITFNDINIPERHYIGNQNRYLTGILQKIDKIILLKKKFCEESHPDQIKKQAVDCLDNMCREYFLPKFKHIFELIPIGQCHLYFYGLTEWLMLSDKIDDQKEILYVIDQYLNKLIVYSPAYDCNILDNSNIILLHGNQPSLSDSYELPPFSSDSASKFVSSCLSADNFDSICDTVITNLLSYINTKSNLSIKKSIIQILVKFNLIGYDLRYFKKMVFDLARNINTNSKTTQKQNSSSDIYSNADSNCIRTPTKPELLDNSFDDSEDESWDNGQCNFLKEDISWFVKKIANLFKTKSPNDTEENKYFENVIPLNELWSTKKFVLFTFEDIKAMLDETTKQKVDELLT